MKETKITKIELNEKKVQSHINKFNAAVNRERKAKISVLTIFLAAYENLSAKEFDLFKQNINYNRNTVNKLEKICKKEIIVKSISLLPGSWGTLYELTRMDDELIKSYLNSKVLNQTTKKEAVLNLLNKNKPISSITTENPETTLGRFEITIKKELSSIALDKKSELIDAFQKLSEFIVFPEELTKTLSQKEGAD